MTAKLNPRNGSPFFSMREVIELTKTLENSYLEKVIPVFREQAVKLGEEAKCEQYIEDNTRNGSFLKCIYIDLIEISTSMVDGYLLAASGEGREWTATLALQLSVPFGDRGSKGSIPMYVVLENISVVSMQHFRGPIVLLNAKHADRLQAIFTR